MAGSRALGAPRADEQRRGGAGDHDGAPAENDQTETIDERGARRLGELLVPAGGAEAGRRDRRRKVPSRVAGRRKLRADAVLQQDTERRDADGEATDPAGVADPGRHTRARRIDDPQRRTRDRRVGESDPDARDDQAGEQHEPAVADRDDRHQPEAERDDREAAAEEQPQRHAGRAPTGHERHGEDERRHRQETKPGTEWGVAIDVLQVDRDERKEREHAGAEAERRDLHADERGSPEEREVEHRPRLPRLDRDEGDEQARARRTASRRSARCSSRRRCREGGRTRSGRAPRRR